MGKRIDRRYVLLKAAFDMLMKQSATGDNVRELEVHYDGTDCDGQCLIEDIADELALDRPEF